MDPRIRIHTKCHGSGTLIFWLVDERSGTLLEPLMNNANLTPKDGVGAGDGESTYLDLTEQGRSSYLYHVFVRGTRGYFM